MTRVAWRDPENISERLTLYAVQGLAGPARQWAEGVREVRADTLFGAPGLAPTSAARPSSVTMAFALNTQAGPRRWSSPRVQALAPMHR
ncbi:MAG: hypothetical protein ACJ76R_01695 [Solirubrobacteraceae bacterium]